MRRPPVRVSSLTARFETGGSIPGRDRAIELGIVAVENGRITHEWESLFNPGGSAVNHYVLKMTGIKMGDLRKAPTFEEMAGEIQAFIGHDVLIAHNLAFDKRFLDAEMYHSTGFIPLNPAICSFQLARRLLPRARQVGRVPPLPPLRSGDGPTPDRPDQRGGPDQRR